jgi:NADH-quinone oxidoreductase subunit L
MAWPLYILAAAAVGIGLMAGPTHLYAHYLHHTPGLTTPHSAHLGVNFAMMGLSTLLALGGIYFAWVRYGQHPGAAGANALATPWEKLSFHGLYLDQLYLAFLVQPLRGVAEACELFDRYVIDQLVDLAGMLPRFFGAVLRPVQNGLIQHYAFVMVLGLAACLLWVLQSIAGS